MAKKKTTPSRKRTSRFSGHSKNDHKRCFLFVTHIFRSYRKKKEVVKLNPSINQCHFFFFFFFFFVFFHFLFFVDSTPYVGKNKKETARGKKKFPRKLVFFLKEMKERNQSQMMMVIKKSIKFCFVFVLF